MNKEKYIYEIDCDFKLGDELVYKNKKHRIVAIEFKISVNDKDNAKVLYSIVDELNHLSTVYENDKGIEIL